MAISLQIKRGPRSGFTNVVLADGELAFCTDTNEVFIGNNNNKILINKSHDLDIDRFVSRETPNGLINNTNRDYYLQYDAVEDTLHVYLNGLLQQLGDDGDYTFTVNNKCISFLSAPQVGDQIKVSYIKSE